MCLLIKNILCEVCLKDMHKKSSEINWIIKLRGLQEWLNPYVRRIGTTASKVQATITMGNLILFCIPLKKQCVCYRY